MSENTAIDEVKERVLELSDHDRGELLLWLWEFTLAKAEGREPGEPIPPEDRLF